MAVERSARIVNPRGLHARPALLLSQQCEAFASAITVTRGKNVADAKRILDLLTLGAAAGAELKVRADGADEEAAAAYVAEFLATYVEDEV
jgi:phosphotransferase system HPr (HPr) family protein